MIVKPLADRLTGSPPVRQPRPWRYALVAVIAVLAVEQVIEHFARRYGIERERISVHEQLSTLRARIEGVVDSNLLLVHGLSAVISAQPDIDQATFERIGRGLVDKRHALRNIAGAPGMVVSLMYPMAGNEAALGLDYRSHPSQRDAALRAIASGESVLAGPMTLAQGGQALALREPVYTFARQPGEAPRLWGLVSAVIDLDTLFRQTGLDTPNANLRLALRGLDGQGARGAVFLGDASLFNEDPVIKTIVVPGGSWQLAALPSQGWGHHLTGVWLIRLLAALFALAAAVMIHRITRDLIERRQTQARLGRLNRVYAVLSSINETIVRQRDTGTLFAESCRIAVEVGGFRMAWIGLADRAGGMVRPSASAGVVEGYLDQVRISLGDDELGQGPTALALKQRQHIACNDIASDPRMQPWRDAALARGYRASVGLPIVVAGEVRGAFNLYADQPGFFDALELKLLDELALDIGFALEFSQAEADLRTERSLLDSVFRVLPDLFFVLDRDGTIRDYRARSDGDLYVPPETFLGKRMQDVLPPGPADLFAGHLDAIYADGGLATFEYDLELAQGVRHFEARLSRLPDSDKAIAVVRDISDRKRMEIEIRQFNAELEGRVAERTAALDNANKELETFAYSVSHDLKAPLRGIDGYSRLLLEDHYDQLDDEGRLFLNNVRHGAEQMTRLIEDLLAYSRMERRDLHGIEVDLADAVARVLAERADELAAHRVEVRLDLAGAHARADPDGLRMVLRNLIDNALKFSHDRHPPSLEITAQAGPESTTLSIRDNGIGFDMQFRERVFEIFQRLQRAEDYPGTGIGLAIVRKAVLRMGGRVWADSSPGQGATFFVELPR